jgi:multidrug efflux pump subunit AcrA (membrane-fusion protein)
VTTATQKLIGLKTVRAEKRQIFSTITLRGRFEINPDAQTSVTTPIAGRLSLKRKTLESVTAGEPLFTITSPDLLMRAAEIQALRQRLANYRAANIANAEIEMQLKLKESEWAALVGDATIVNGSLTINAPISGVLEQRFTNDGAWVELGAPIVQLRPQNALRYKALLSPNTAKQLSNGKHVHYGNHHGSLRLGLTAESGLTPVYLYFEEPLQSECDGTYAEIDVVLEGHETPVVAIPKRALVQIGVQPTVFIRDAHDDTRFIAYPVTLGHAANGWVAVEGLPSHESEIVIAGQYELKLALPSDKPKEAGHYHADGTFHAGEH